MLSYPMPPYPVASAAAAGRLLCVNETVAHGRKPGFAGPGTAGRRVRRRQLARAAARVERSQTYQRSLAQLAELAASFRAELAPAQRDRWLSLEEAVLEQVAKLNRSYFHAGAAYGEELGRLRRSQQHAAKSAIYRRERLEREVIVELAAIIARLARR